MFEFKFLLEKKKKLSVYSFVELTTVNQPKGRQQEIPDQARIPDNTNRTISCHAKVAWNSPTKAKTLF